MTLPVNDAVPGAVRQLRHGLQVPLSRRVLALVRAAEAAGNGATRLTPGQIRSPSALQIQQTS